MTYRESAELPGMDWKKVFSDFYQGQKNMNVKDFANSLSKEDKFVPPAIDRLTDADLEALLRMSRHLEKLALQNSYNHFFLHLINKVITLVLHNFPEAFVTLTDQEKEKVLGFKIELPNEVAVFNQVYAYMQGHVELPFATFDNGATIRSILEKVKKELDAEKGNRSNSLINQRVLDSVVAVNSQYSLYFYDLHPFT